MSTAPQSPASIKSRDRDGSIDAEHCGARKTRRTTRLRSSLEGYKFESKSNASVRTATSLSSTTLSWVKRWTSAPNEKTGPQEFLTPRTEARRLFICAITNNTQITDQTLLDACEFYANYVENKMRESWTTRIKPVLRDVSSFVIPTIGDMTIAFRFMTAAVFELNKQKPSMALTDLVDPLYDLHLLKDTDEYRTEAYQLVYAAIGWLSSLYTPKLNDFDSRFVSVENPSQTPKPARIFSSHQPLQKPKSSTQYLLDDNKDHPLIQLLNRFGKTFSRLLVAVSRTPSDTWIDEDVLNFHILTRVAHIEIEWVEDLGAHLQFDVRSKKLKLFKYPSLCLVLLTNPHASAWLSAPPHKIHPVFYYHEILLTYRLIFESKKLASAQFLRLMPSWADSLWDANPNASHYLTTHRKTILDPLLPILCGSYHDAAVPSALYDAIEAEPLSTKNHYNAVDFPFLGGRLLELQDHVKSKKANTLGGLWHDGRVPSEWWTFWAVIIIGGGTLVLGLMSVALQIGGLVLSKQQVDASRHGF